MAKRVKGFRLSDQALKWLGFIKSKGLSETAAVETALGAYSTALIIAEESKTNAGINVEQHNNASKSVKSLSNEAKLNENEGV
ncbi:MAG: hypothetical protein V1494_00590 [Candidatus Diapherotrites archaeon]